MLISRQVFLLFVLVLIFVLHTPHDLLAVGEEHPIIARAGNKIYAVSPRDGEARLLVEHSPENSDIGFVASGYKMQLSPISPDNTKFAYIGPVYEWLEPAFEAYEQYIIDIDPNDIMLVDIATGELTRITDQAANFTEAFENDKLTHISHLTWSIDGQRLYFLASVLSMRNRVPRQTIEYYDLVSGERRILARIVKQIDIRGLYAINQGLLTLGRPKKSADLELALYDHDGQSNSIVMSLSARLSCMGGVMFRMNPIFNNDVYYYGAYPFTETQRVLTPTLLDVTSGSRIPVDEGFLPALMSHAHADTSWRIVSPDSCFGSVSEWTVTDAEGNPMNSISLSGFDDVFDREMAISPDGEAIAYLKDEAAAPYSTLPIVVVTAEGTHELDFSADEILWGALDFAFAPVLHSD